MGGDWGEDGVFRIVWGENQCKIESLIQWYVVFLNVFPSWNFPEYILPFQEPDAKARSEDDTSNCSKRFRQL